MNMAPEDRIEMLKWLSARNMHMPVSELAFLLGLPFSDGEDVDTEAPLPPVQ